MMEDMTVAMMKVLFKKDANGSMRTWQVERECVNARYRVHHGVLGGATVTTGWVNVQGNTLRSPSEQCASEVEALYKHKLKTDYFDSQVEAMAGPRHLEPMLAKGWDKIGKKFGMPWEWILQPKLDGIRCLAKADGCFSRSGEKFLTTGPIEEALRSLFEANPDLVLDGELYNHEFHDRFNELSGLIRKGMNAKTPPTVEELSMAHSVMQYHVYDMPSHPGEQDERARELVELVHEVHPLLFYVDTWDCSSEERADELYERWLQEGYEGMMYRRKSALYQYGKRPWDLLKRKQFETAEFRIKRIEEGEGDWKGRAKRIVFEWHDGREFGSGLRGDRDGFCKKLFDDWVLGECEYESATVRYMPPPEGAVPRVAVAIDWHGKDGRTD